MAGRAWWPSVPKMRATKNELWQKKEVRAKAYALALYAIANDVERQDKEIPDTISVLRVPRESVDDRLTLRPEDRRIQLVGECRDS